MKFVTLLCCINPSVESKNISELTIYNVISAFAPIKNIKLIGREGQVKAFLQVDNPQVAEALIEQLNGKTLQFGRIKVFYSHKKYVAFEKPLTQVLAEATNGIIHSLHDSRSSRLNSAEAYANIVDNMSSVQNSGKCDYLFEHNSARHGFLAHSSRSIIDDLYDNAQDFYGQPNVNTISSCKKLMPMHTKSTTDLNKITSVTEIDTPRTVLMQNIRTDRVSCQMLFNLFGCFGNIHQLWFIEDKGIVLIQYEQAVDAEAVAKSAHLVPYFDLEMEMSLITQAQASHLISTINNDNIKFVKGSFKFYRYKDGSKKPIKEFTKVLHFTNISDKLTCEALCIVIASIHTPIRFIQGQFKDFTEISYIVEFNNFQQCLEVLSLLHNRKVEGRKLHVEFTDTDIDGTSSI